MAADTLDDCHLFICGCCYDWQCLVFLTLLVMPAAHISVSASGTHLHKTDLCIWFFWKPSRFNVFSTWTPASGWNILIGEENLWQKISACYQLPWRCWHCAHNEPGAGSQPFINRGCKNKRTKHNLRSEGIYDSAAMCLYAHMCTLAPVLPPAVLWSTGLAASFRLKCSSLSGWPVPCGLKIPPGVFRLIVLRCRVHLMKRKIDIDRSDHTLMRGTQKVT